MRFDPACYLVGGILLLLFVLPRWLGRVVRTAPGAPKPSRPTRAPKPFAGYTHKPECALCDQDIDSPPQAPNAPPPRMIFTRGRRRSVETTGHFCPQATCAYHGWVGWGNIRANGHPNGRRWRQLVILKPSRATSCMTLEPEGGVPVPGAPVAAATGEVQTGR